jgi:hypothetical protein
MLHPRNPDTTENSETKAAMSERIHTYTHGFDGHSGRHYRVHVHGHERRDGTWSGWLVFEPDDGGEPIVTGRETTQPNRVDLDYWAGGLEIAYFEGALQRALHAIAQYDPYEKLPSGVHKGTAGTRERPRPHAVLNPFAVYMQGHELLRQELRALSPDHLRGIVRAFYLAEDRTDIGEMEQEELAALIVAAVEARMGE